MKKRFKLRKTLQEIATRMGIEDLTQLTGQMKPGSKDQGYMELVNNQRRFVRGLLKLPVAEQQARINYFKRVIEETEAEDAAKVKT